MRRCRSAAVAAFVAFLVAGCVSTHGPDPADSYPVQETGTVVELESTRPYEPEPPPSLGARTFTEPASLTGPRFSLEVRWVATARVIHSYVSTTTVSVSERRAPHGHELVVAAVDGDAGRALWEVGEAPPPRAELVLDGVPTRLVEVLRPENSAFGDDTVVVASVPVGASVSLRVTDQGRVQTLDLRTGRRGDDAIAAYYRSASQELEFDEEVPFGYVHGGVRWPATLMIRGSGVGDLGSTAVLTPWTPTTGWAPDGRIRLLVPRPAMYSVPGLVFRLDDAEAFRVRLPDGTVIPEAGGTRTVNTSIAPGSDEPLLFDVPGDFAAGVLVIRVGNPRAVVDGLDDEPVRWVTATRPVEVPLRLG